jgi:peptidoglycan-associated lipoprotein
VLANRSVYFDFDSYVVRADGKPVVENHSAYLVKNKARSILVQGNTDERGGAEYNWRWARNVLKPCARP